MSGNDILSPYSTNCLLRYAAAGFGDQLSGAALHPHHKVRQIAGLVVSDRLLGASAVIGGAMVSVVAMLYATLRDLIQLMGIDRHQED